LPYAYERYVRKATDTVEEMHAEQEEEAL